MTELYVLILAVSTLLSSTTVDAYTDLPIIAGNGTYANTFGVIGAKPDGTIYSGDGTYYNTYDSYGACGTILHDTDMIVAISTTLYDQSMPFGDFNPNHATACGRKICATGPNGSITVTVADRCGGCKLYDLDFTQNEFPLIGQIEKGRIKITWQWCDAVVPPPTQIIGIQKDKALYTKNGINGAWAPIVSPARLVDLIQVPGTGIVGVAPDNTIWYASSLTSTWTLAPNSGYILSLAVLSDQRTYIGVGMDKVLWTRIGLSGYWVQVPWSGYVYDVAVLSDGRILGVGLDYQLYTRQTLYANWVLVPNSGSVYRAKQMPDGSIVGVGMDYNLWQMATLGAAWIQIPNSCCVLSVVSF